MSQIWHANFTWFLGSVTDTVGLMRWVENRDVKRSENLFCRVDTLSSNVVLNSPLVIECTIMTWIDFSLANIKKLLMFICATMYYVIQLDYFIVSSVQIYHWKRLQKSLNEMKMIKYIDHFFFFLYIYFSFSIMHELNLIQCQKKKKKKKTIKQHADGMDKTASSSWH